MKLCNRKGGHRPGAGRPRKDSRPVHIRLAWDLYRWLTKRPGTISNQIEQIVREFHDFVTKE